MIYIKLDGRLGNNLFQIAAGASLAEKLGVAYKSTDRSWISLLSRYMFVGEIIWTCRGITRSVKWIIMKRL
jgi:hypothetical protein